MKHTFSKKKIKTFPAVNMKTLLVHIVYDTYIKSQIITQYDYSSSIKFETLVT